MRKALALLLVTLATHVASAQMFGEKGVSPATKAYHAYRFETTEPPFALRKVKRLIAAIRPVKGKDEEEVNASPAWDRMSVPEKFTYCMLHGEDASQNCDGMPWVVDEEHKVFAYAAGFFGDQVWSERQLAFLRGHRSEVVRLLRATIRERGRVGSNLKDAIGYLNTNELIPDLIGVYNRDHKDGDILTVLMLLMRDGKYAPFLASATYKKLYGDEASSQSYIVANEANRKLMFSRAMAFYRTRVH